MLCLRTCPLMILKSSRSAHAVTSALGRFEYFEAGHLSWTALLVLRL